MILTQVFPLIAGGLDTTTSLFLNAVVHLSQHPALRQQLIDHPELRPAATEEMLRFYTPVQGLARTVTRDCPFGDVEMQRGDRVLLSYGSANRDGRAFPDPDEFVVDRFPNRHFAFGIGIHRCIGSTFARMEFGVMLDEILERLPDFHVDQSRAQQYPIIGLVNGYISVPATFTPGPRRGPTRIPGLERAS